MLKIRCRMSNPTNIYFEKPAQNAIKKTRRIAGILRKIGIAIPSTNAKNVGGPLVELDGTQQFNNQITALDVALGNLNSARKLAARLQLVALLPVELCPADLVAGLTRSSAVPPCIQVWISKRRQDFQFAQPVLEKLPKPVTTAAMVGWSKLPTEMA